MRKELLALAGAAGAGLAIWLLGRKAEAAPSPAGGLGIEAEVLGSTVTATITATATAGTPPITVDIFAEVRDKDTMQVVTTKTYSETITDLTRPVKTSFSFVGVPGKTYIISARATFTNAWGSDTATASKEVTIPGAAPRGEISVEVAVT